jgi:hypothetical protein
VIKLVLKLAALSFLECMLITACMYVGCRLVDDVAIIAMDPTPALLLEIPVLVLCGIVTGSLTVLVAVYIVYILLELADRIMYNVKARELFDTY